MEARTDATPDGALTPGQRKWTYLRRSLRGRCPQCGEGKLFASYAKLHETCPECGLQFRRESGSATGAMYLSAAITEVFAAGLALAIFFLTDFGFWGSFLLSLPPFLLFTFWFLPRAIGAWCAIDYMVDESHGEDWVQPRFGEPAAPTSTD